MENICDKMIRLIKKQETEWERIFANYLAAKGLNI